MPSAAAAWIGITTETNMPEIDITNFVRTAEASDFSASVAEIGKNAGPITWGNALREAAHAPLLTTEQLDDFRSWAKEFGAWSAAELAAMNADQCNALLIQFISGDLRELESLCPSDTDPFGIDWDEARALSEQGTIGGSIYPANDRLYFSMCH